MSAGGARSPAPRATSWSSPSAIHLNRTLRHLRERGLMTLRAGKVTIDDEAGLLALAVFENGHLDQGPNLRHGDAPA